MIRRAIAIAIAALALAGPGFTPVTRMTQIYHP